MELEEESMGCRKKLSDNKHQKKQIDISGPQQ